MKKSLFLLLLYCGVVSICYAQRIEGIIQSSGNRPVEFANIVLLNRQDSTFLAGSISDENGHFILNIPHQAEASCLIRVTCIGYKTLNQPVQPGNTGIIRLEENTQLLGEVVVKSNLPTTRLKGDALVTHVAGSVLAQSGTAGKLLDYIPGVVSQNGSLQVLGRGTPVVYINGRPVYDAAELEQLSSEAIESVEVVRYPGSRYAASTRAVIRIRTRKTEGEGIGGSSSTQADYDDNYWDAYQQIDLNYRRSKLDVFGMLYLYRYTDRQAFAMSQDTYLEKHWQQRFDATGKAKGKSLTTNFGMNYTPNADHSVGFRYRYYRRPQNSGSGTFDADITADGEAHENTFSLSNTNAQATQHSVNLYYAGKIKRWSIDFNTDLLWDDAKESQYNQEQITPAAGIATNQTITTFSDTGNKLYATKLTISHPLLGGELAFGSEFSHTDRDNNFHNPQEILENDASEIKESNTAAFATFSRELGFFQLQAGIRYEHIAFDYYQDGVRREEESKKYDNFFPSFSAGATVGKVQMQISYTQNISRPPFYSYRSSISYANHYTYETGNPLLQPAINHYVALTGTYKWCQLTTSYQHNKDNRMTTAVPYSDADPNIALFMPINAPSYNAADIQISATPTIGWWSPRFTIAAQKQWFKTETYGGKKSLDKPQLYLRWQNYIKLPAGILCSLNGYWCSKYDRINMHSNRSDWGIDASLRKSFLNGRIDIQVNGYDIFLSQRTNLTTYQGEIYTMQRILTPNTRSVSMKITYKFNQAKDKYKGTGAGNSQRYRL